MLLPLLVRKYWPMLLFFVVIIFLFLFNWEFIKNLDNTTEVMISLSTTIATLSVAFLVYRYTTDNNRKQLLNALDEKSGWRKKLFELASREIEVEDIHILRASLRFNFKDNPDNYFDIMTKLIILYCEKVIENYKDDFSLKYSNDLIITSRFNEEIVRLFARYLLADHWEKNQLSDFKTIYYKKFEKIADENYQKYIKSLLEKNNNTKLNENNPCFFADYIKADYIKKERELFIHTTNEFIRLSNLSKI